MPGFLKNTHLVGLFGAVFVVAMAACSGANQVPAIGQSSTCPSLDVGPAELAPREAAYEVTIPVSLPGEWMVTQLDEIQDTGLVTIPMEIKPRDASSLSVQLWADVSGDVIEDPEWKDVIPLALGCALQGALANDVLHLDQDAADMASVKVASGEEKFHMCGSALPGSSGLTGCFSQHVHDVLNTPGFLPTDIYTSTTTLHDDQGRPMPSIVFRWRAESISQELLKQMENNRHLIVLDVASRPAEPLPRNVFWIPAPDTSNLFWPNPCNTSPYFQSVFPAGMDAIAELIKKRTDSLRLGTQIVGESGRILTGNDVGTDAFRTPIQTTYPRYRVWLVNQRENLQCSIDIKAQLIRDGSGPQYPTPLDVPFGGNLVVAIMAGMAWLSFIVALAWMTRYVVTLLDKDVSGSATELRE